MKRPRRNHLPAFKAKVASEALKGEKMISQLAAEDRRDHQRWCGVEVSRRRG
jgi:hypothetical protein